MRIFIHFFVAVMVAFNFSMPVVASELSIEEQSLEVKVFYGFEIDPYSKDLSDLVLKAFKEYPYLYETNDHYKDFLESYGKYSDTIVAMAFDQGKLIGVATGIPLQSAGKYQDPVRAKGFDPRAMFYLGELVVEKQYRKQGLGKLLYDHLEAAVKSEGKYDSMILYQIEDSRYDAKKPAGYISTDGFWKKLGFEHHPEIHKTSHWINVGESEKTPHFMVYWIKNF